MECAICEMDLRGGHAPACPRRCQALSDETGTWQCEMGFGHIGPHGVYDENAERWVGTWPSREGEPVRAGELLGTAALLAEAARWPEGKGVTPAASPRDLIARLAAAVRALTEEVHHG